MAEITAVMVVTLYERDPLERGGQVAMLTTLLIGKAKTLRENLGLPRPKNRLFRRGGEVLLLELGRPKAKGQRLILSGAPLRNCVRYRALWETLQRLKRG